MKNIYVLAGDTSACAYYRVILPYVLLETVDTGKYDVKISATFTKDLVDWADIVVIQRHAVKEILDIILYAKMLNKQVIYDMDDNAHEILDSNKATKEWFSDKLEIIEEIIRLSDKVTVASDGLREYYTYLNKHIYTIENYIDPKSFPEKIYNTSGIIRIGWAGSGSHREDMQAIVHPVIKTLQKYKNTEFVMVGQDFRDLFNHKRVKYLGNNFTGLDDPRRTCYSAIDTVTEYYKLLNTATFDIAIAPIKNNKFNNCRSTVKIIEYGTLAIPVVAANVEPYKTFFKEDRFDKAKNKGYGFLYSSNTELQYILGELIENELLRRTMGIKLRQYVEDYYLIWQNVYKWVDLLGAK